MHSTLNWGRRKSYFQRKEKISTFFEESQVFLSGLPKLEGNYLPHPLTHLRPPLTAFVRKSKRNEHLMRCSYPCILHRLPSPHPNPPSPPPRHLLLSRLLTLVRFIDLIIIIETKGITKYFNFSSKQCAAVELQ